MAVPHKVQDVKIRNRKRACPALIGLLTGTCLQALHITILSIFIDTKTSYNGIGLLEMPGAG
jgi:hypothetical protein